MFKAQKMIKAQKQRISEPIVDWEPHDDRRIVIYGITHEGTVTTHSGVMERVQLRQNAEVADPNQDVACHIGWVVQNSTHRPGATAPELWYWNDNYWLKARVPGKGEWYNKGSYLLYIVNVIETAGFINMLAEERNAILALRK